MATGVVSWSQTAASNATADSTVNFQEGQAPSSLNDSNRAVMASVAKYRDDISGAIATGGTSTAYTITSYQVFASLAAMSGQMIAFTPHITSGNAPTLNVDGLGAKKIRFQTGADIPDGSLVEGTPYIATYYNAVGEFILHNIGGYPYAIPLGSGIDHWGATAPNSAFAFAYGQAISRTTYATLFASFGTTYGAGDGLTTFNIPDKRGRVSAAKDDMGGTPANRLPSSGAVNGTVLGYTGGSDRETLAAAQIPSITSSNPTQPISVTSTQGGIPFNTTNSGNTGSGGAFNGPYFAGSISINRIDSTGNNTINVTSNNTSGQSHNNVQPTIVCNYIIRII